MKITSIYDSLVGLCILSYIALISLQPSLPFIFMPKDIGYLMDKQRVLELILLSFVLATCVISSRQDSIPIHQRLRLPLIIILILSVFSVLLAYVPRHAAIEASTFAALCYLSLTIAKLYKNDSDRFIQYLSYVLWASALLYLLSFYTGYLAATISGKPLNWPDPFNGFTNIRSFNQYQLGFIGVLYLPLLCFNLRKSLHITLHIALIAWWSLLFYSASRGVLIAWIVAIILTALLYKRSAWPFIKLQISHITLGFINFFLLFKAIPSINNKTLNTSTIVRNSTDDRLALWDQAFMMIKTFPFFGAGPMHFAWYSKTNGHPHNSILQLASEWGLPATVMILGVAAYGLFVYINKMSLNNLQQESKLNKNLAVILLFTIFANFSYSLVDGVFVMPISQVLMFTILGVMLGQYLSEKPIKTRYQSRLRPTFAILLIIILSWSAYPELRQGFSKDEKVFSMGHTALGPRYWRETK